MGMNVVRFYMNHLTFESDAAPGRCWPTAGSGWTTDIAWAKKNHVYLVLNMHVRPGAFSRSATARRCGTAPSARSG